MHRRIRGYDPVLIETELFNTAFYKELQGTSTNIIIRPVTYRGGGRYVTFDMPSVESADKAVETLRQLFQDHGTKAHSITNAFDLGWRHKDWKEEAALLTESASTKRQFHVGNELLREGGEGWAYTNRIEIYVGNSGMKSFVDKIIDSLNQFYAGNEELQTLAKGPKTSAVAAKDAATTTVSGWSDRPRGVANGGRG